ncbi:hypothetical protein HX99_06880 [Peptococcaceae bacterium SCADC1_2_3]|jgi:hypothetical protein|nr:hypothetical protein DK28_0213350 [Peptococcaceae bacterium SCADC1_2_3]KFI36891.1 hypothetical protein HX99_06880 [Peptococcaceae bacterium SCADC1_2_3]KFI37973.1 hypothetical protein HY02_00525 [Peptococcaceae bacterium SCADC1_2_3]HBQ29265.1 hypothetical protein [Desulfotomaculum sp.]HCJ79356.1 hypothetical protein [Desulfotomaculum sp.]
MLRLFHLLEKHRFSLLKKTNVVGVGIGYKQIAREYTREPSLVIFVAKKVPAHALNRQEAVPKQIGGLPTDVVEIGEVALLNERFLKERPARPGLSIGHYKVSAGTFGAVVKDNLTKEKLILSNNHVLANATNGKDGRAKAGDPILQPGAYDGGGADDRIATLFRFVPVKRVTQESDCPVAAGIEKAGNLFLKLARPNYELRLLKKFFIFNYVDAAVALPDAPGLVNEEILEIDKVEGVAEAELGQKVIKSGRTSGLTAGKVIAHKVTLKVTLSAQEEAWFSDQVITDMLSRPGDSGSLVLTTGKKAVGLLFAGSAEYSIFNQLKHVFGLLKTHL